jgi:biopolymer transport protein ExbD
MKHASVKDVSSGLRSPLLDAMLLKPTRRGMKKKTVMALVLTSLVDAFSILLLYLLTANTGNGSTLELDKTEKLPMAIKTEALNAGTIVRVENGRYFLGNIQINATELAAKLQVEQASLPKGSADSQSLIIQADRNMDFAMLTPVIRAGSISGFNKFKFAVLQDEGQL